MTPRGHAKTPKRLPGRLAEIIAEEIGRLGPMRFDRYMELALYGPGGFYERTPVGSGADHDFVTSPHVHEVFAHLVAEAIRGLLDAMAVPPADAKVDPMADPHTEPGRAPEIVEVGAGDGTLVRDLLRELDDLAPTVTAVERSRRALEELATIEGLTVREQLPASTPPVVVLAHELLDNLPFRRLRPTPGGMVEVHVGVEASGLVEVLLPVTDRVRPSAIGDDGEAIVPTGAVTFMTEALTGPVPRAMLAIDYGADRGAGGPVHGYSGHRVAEDLLANPGETDITAGVDFGCLADAARAHGFQPFPTVSQRAVLIALGLETWLRTELERQQDLLNTGRGAEAVRAWEGRNRATVLADPSGLGRFRWFVVTTPGVAEPSWLRRAR